MHEISLVLAGEPFRQPPAEPAIVLPLAVPLTRPIEAAGSAVPSLWALQQQHVEEKALRDAEAEEHMKQARKAAQMGPGGMDVLNKAAAKLRSLVTEAEKRSAGGDGASGADAPVSQMRTGGGSGAAGGTDGDGGSLQRGRMVSTDSRRSRGGRGSVSSQSPGGSGRRRASSRRSSNASSINDISLATGADAGLALVSPQVAAAHAALSGPLGPALVSPPMPAGPSNGAPLPPSHVHLPSGTDVISTRRARAARALAGSGLKLSSGLAEDAAATGALPVSGTTGRALAGESSLAMGEGLGFSAEHNSW